MPNYIRRKPKKPSFSQKGLDGYGFPLSNKKMEVNFVNVREGHDNFIISKKITHIYYILRGKGFFNIKGKRYTVRPGMLIEVPPNVEYVYSGRMKLLLIMNPPWFKGNEIITKKNPFVK
jgi:mannose-6-phosphate isomerase-like protein (cupin superfamily)